MALKTCLMIGGSGMAGSWIRNFVGNFSDRIKIIGLADVLPDVLETAGRSTPGLSEKSVVHGLQRSMCNGQSGLLRRCDTPAIPQSRSDRCDGETECR